MDDFTAQRGIAAVDIFKMDIQGTELLVLKGADRLLRSRAIKLIDSEVLFAKM